MLMLMVVRPCYCTLARGGGSSAFPRLPLPCYRALALYELDAGWLVCAVFVGPLFPTRRFLRSSRGGRNDAVPVHDTTPFTLIILSLETLKCNLL